MEVDKGADKMTTKAKAKKSGLAAFSQKTTKVAEVAENQDRVRRGQGDTVAITVRLSKDQWMKLRQFAMSEGETLQTVAMNGFNRELAAKGMPPLDV
jgi:hypothetical protein